MSSVALSLFHSSFQGMEAPPQRQRARSWDGTRGTNAILNGTHSPGRQRPTPRTPRTCDRPARRNATYGADTRACQAGHHPAQRKARKFHRNRPGAMINKKSRYSKFVKARMIQHAQSVAAEQPSLMANVWKLVAGPDNAEEAELNQQAVGITWTWVWNFGISWVIMTTYAMIIWNVAHETGNFESEG